MSEPDYALERRQMVAEQIARRGLTDPRLLAAIEAVPRHRFVDAANRLWAYADNPLPIGHGQTISQPYIVALMINLLRLRGDERVLEVGTGSGYQAAILAHLAAEVHTVEFVPELAESARRMFEELGLENVSCHVGDGSLGWKEAAPYDAVIVAAAAPGAPRPLLGQLAEGGRLVIPVGGRGYQELETWHRRGDDFSMEKGIGVAFVPLLGEHGWKSGF
ncbi:MAG: protein-L-isoaspartate(D-aspartate) O-methyltransferase [Chloroflexota bacterium]